MLSDAQKVKNNFRGNADGAMDAVVERGIPDETRLLSSEDVSFGSPCAWPA